jgi:hypothetical protein
MERGRYNRERIVELRQAHPEMTLEAIGQQVSLSKERVRQVLVKAEMTTLSTGRVSTKRKPIQPCTQCGSLEKTFITKHSMFCSPKCLYIAQQYNWKQWHNDNPDRNTTYTCTYCGKLKTIRTTLYKRQVKQHKNLFCSHACSLSAQWKDKNSALSISRQSNTQLDGLDLTS